MMKLASGIHHMLNEHAINSLKDKNIKTVSDLLHTDSNKLKQFLALGKQTIILIFFSLQTVKLYIKISKIA